jgi:addiction module HigA family antidote
MDKHTSNEYQPDYIVTPGEVLSTELELRGMSQIELAKRTGLTPKHIVAIIKANSALTPETAIKLERAIGMPAQFWLNLESLYQEDLARIAEEEKLIKDIDWLKRIPIAVMVKFGWINKLKNPKDQLIEVLRYFGIADVNQWDKMWPEVKVAFRQHNHIEIIPEAVSAWLRKGEIESGKIDCLPFDRANFRMALDEIKKLTIESPEVFVPKMQDLCAKSGVAVTFVPGLPKTGVSGATRWLSPKKASIQLSLRYKTDDHFWFTFFHEAGHILLHGKKEYFLEGVSGQDLEKEAQANSFSEAELIPKKAFEDFVKLGNFSKSEINKFALEIGISKGIVVGRLQHKTLLDNSYCNDLKQSYKWVDITAI